MYLSPITAVIMRGQQQKPVHPTCHLQHLTFKHCFTSHPQHIKNSTSGISVYEGMCRWQVTPEACLIWGLCALWYEGDSTNSLCRCKFSTRKGGLPISRPCLIHQLSVLHCFFFQCKFLVLLQNYLPIYSQSRGQGHRGQTAC